MNVKSHCGLLFRSEKRNDVLGFADFHNGLFEPIAIICIAFDHDVACIWKDGLRAATPPTDECTYVHQRTWHKSV